MNLTDEEFAAACERFADRTPEKVTRVPLAGKRYSELAWFCAKALGRVAPLTSETKAAALRDFGAGTIVNHDYADNARALARELVEAGWFA